MELAALAKIEEDRLKLHAMQKMQADELQAQRKREFEDWILNNPEKKEEAKSLWAKKYPIMPESDGGVRGILWSWYFKDEELPSWA